MKVETAAAKGAKFADRVRRFDRGQWPTCGRVLVVRVRFVAVRLADEPQTRAPRDMRSHRQSV